MPTTLDDVDERQTSCARFILLLRSYASFPSSDYASFSFSFDFPSHGPATAAENLVYATRHCPHRLEVRLLTTQRRESPALSPRAAQHSGKHRTTPRTCTSSSNVHIIIIIHTNLGPWFCHSSYSLSLTFFLVPSPHPSHPPPHNNCYTYVQSCVCDLRPASCDLRPATCACVLHKTT